MATDLGEGKLWIQTYWTPLKKMIVHGEGLYISKVGDLSQRWTNGSFSIATTLRCRGGHYSIPRIAPLYPWSSPLAQSIWPEQSWRAVWWSLGRLALGHAGIIFTHTHTHTHIYIYISYICSSNFILFRYVILCINQINILDILCI